MTTYEKLGQYASSELPIAPSNVVITAVGSTTADLEWTNNYVGDSGSIILQLWETNYWHTHNEIDKSSTSSTMTDLPAGESWRIRVAVLLNGVIYPAPPVVNSLPPTPLPTNLTYVGNDSNFISTISWDGNDSSWENILIRAAIAMPEVDCNDTSWKTVATLTGSGATSYAITGLSLTQNTYWSVGCTIGGEAKTQDDNVQVQVNAIMESFDNSLRVGGTFIKSDFSDWNEAKQLERVNDAAYIFGGDSAGTYCNKRNTMDCGQGLSGGTIIIRNNNMGMGDSRPRFYQFKASDFKTLTGIADGGNNTFIRTCGVSNINQYYLLINFRELSITLAPLNV